MTDSGLDEARELKPCSAGRWGLRGFLEFTDHTSAAAGLARRPRSPGHTSSTTSRHNGASAQDAHGTSTTDQLQRLRALETPESEERLDRSAAPTRTTTLPSVGPRDVRDYQDKQVASPGAVAQRHDRPLSAGSVIGEVLSPVRPCDDFAATVSSRLPGPEPTVNASSKATRSFSMRTFDDAARRASTTLLRDVSTALYPTDGRPDSARTPGSCKERSRLSTTTWGNSTPNAYGRRRMSVAQNPEKLAELHGCLSKATN